MKILERLLILCFLIYFFIPQPAYAENAVQWYEKGRSYYSAKDYSNAINAYGEAIRQNPRLLLAFLERGICYLSKGDYDRAINDCTKAIEIDPMMEKAYIGRAIAFQHKGDFDAAIHDLDTAIQLNDKNALNYFSRATLYVQKKQLDLAIADYSQAIKFQPGNEEYYLVRAAAYVKNDDFASAIRDYSTILALNPGYIPAYLQRGSIYNSQKKYELALADFNKILELQPDNADAFFNRGILMYNISKFNLAVINFDKAIQFKHQRSYWVYVYKGFSYEKIGCFRDAYQAYQAALTQAPATDAQFPLNEIKDHLKPLQLLYGQDNEHETKMLSWVEKESPVSAAEKAVIKTFVGIFDAYNKKDFSQFKVNFPGAMPITTFEEMVNNSKNCILHAAEVYSYSGKTIRGRITFSYQALNTSHIGETIVLGQGDVYLENRENHWVLVEFRRYVPNDNSMKPILANFQLREKAKQRYGTDDLANWQRLNP